MTLSSYNLETSRIMTVLEDRLTKTALQEKGDPLTIDYG